jgi:hypothetical protein
LRSLPFSASNDFFNQFQNCLSYVSKKGCVEKVKWALENDPQPLSDEEKYKLMWEGANERLFKSSAMTETQAKDRNNRCSDFAKLHMDTMKTGSFLASFLGAGSKKKDEVLEVK